MNEREFLKQWKPLKAIAEKCYQPDHANYLLIMKEAEKDISDPELIDKLLGEMTADVHEIHAITYMVWAVEHWLNNGLGYARVINGISMVFETLTNDRYYQDIYHDQDNDHTKNLHKLGSLTKKLMERL